MIFSLVEVPVINLGTSQRVHDSELPFTARINVDSSPKAPVKCSSATKSTIRNKIKGKALDFTETTNIRKAWTEKVVTNQNMCIFDDNIMGDNDKLVQFTPDKKGLPVIYGSNVTMDSPDPFSKYHEGPGPKADSSPGFNSHGFDSECEMSTPVKTEGIPLIYGSKVTMNSPDPFSKFHEGPDPKLELSFMKDDIDINTSSLKELVSGRKVVLNGGDKTRNPSQIISPQGIADLDDLDMAATFGSSVTPVKSLDISCRTGGFGHVETGLGATLRPKTGNDKCTISDIRKLIGSASTSVSLSQPVQSPSKAQKPTIESSVEPRPKSGSNSSTRRPLQPLSANTIQPRVSQSMTSLQALKQQQQHATVAVQENVRPSTGYHVNSTRQPHHIYYDPLAKPEQCSIARPTVKLPLKPTPPPGPPPGSIVAGSASGVNGQSCGRRNLMRDKDLEPASQTATTGGSSVAPMNQSARPTSVTRRGRTYVEAKDPAVGQEARSNGGSSFLITNSKASQPTGADILFISSDTPNQPQHLEIVGGSCILGKGQGHGSGDDSMMITGRPISARTTVVSPVKEFDNVATSRHIPIEPESFPINFHDQLEGVQESASGQGSNQVVSSSIGRGGRSVKVSCVSSDPNSSSHSQRRKKTSRKLPFKPLSQLHSIPEDAEVEHGVPAWLTVIGKFQADAALRSIMDDMDSLLSSAESMKMESLALSTSSIHLNSTMKRGQFKLGKVDVSRDEPATGGRTSRIDNRGDTYNLWMSNQMICTALSSSQSTIFTAIRANNMEMIKEKVELGDWTLTSLDAVGNSPLIVAVFSGIGRIVRYFIKSGADMDTQNRFGNTALHFSAELEYDKVTNYLVKKGASTKITNSMGYVYDQRM